MYQNPAHDPNCKLSESELASYFETFYEDVFCELVKYGNLLEMHVCDNVGDHLIGNVYARYEWEDEAQIAVDAFNQRWYAGEWSMILVFPSSFLPSSPFVIRFSFLVESSRLVAAGFVWNPINTFQQSATFAYVTIRSTWAPWNLLTEHWMLSLFLTGGVGFLSMTYVWWSCSIGRPLFAELSPVTDFREACCRQNDMGECNRGGFCNFMWAFVPEGRVEVVLVLVVIDHVPVGWEVSLRTGISKSLAPLSFVNFTLNSASSVGWTHPLEIVSEHVRLPSLGARQEVILWMKILNLPTTVNEMENDAALITIAHSEKCDGSVSIKRVEPRSRHLCIISPFSSPCNCEKQSRIWLKCETYRLVPQPSAPIPHTLPDFYFYFPKNRSHVLDCLDSWASPIQGVRNRVWWCIGPNSSVYTQRSPPEPDRLIRMWFDRRLSLLRLILIWWCHVSFFTLFQVC